MKRFLLIAVLLVIAGALLLPGPVGRFAQQAHDREFAALAGSDSIALESYQRGWFSTQAQHRLSLKSLLKHQQWVPALSEEAALVVRSELQHGLLPVGNAGTLGTLTSRLSLDLGDEPIPIPGQVATRVTSSGDVEITYNASADADNTAHGQQLHWDDAQLHLQLNRQFTRFSVKGDIGRLRFTPTHAVQDHGQSLTLGPLSIDAAHQRRPSGLWVGSSEIAMTVDASPHLRADGAHLHWQTEAQPAGVASAVSFSAEQIGYNGWTGKGARLRAQIDRVSEPALASVVQALLNLASTHAATEQRELELQLVEAVQQLLANGGDFRLKEMHLPTRFGIATGRGELRVSSTAGDPSPYALLANTRGELHSRIPARLLTTTLARNPKFKDAFRYAVMLGVLAPEAGYYLTEAAYDGAQLYVNGRTLPLPF